MREKEEADDKGGERARPCDACAKGLHHEPNSGWRCPPHGEHQPHAMQLPSSATAMQIPLKCAQSEGM
jgi:hypothetical protein